MRAFDTCRMGSTVFTCAKSDDAARKAMKPILQAYLSRREQDVPVSLASNRLSKLRETADAFEILQAVIDPGCLTVLPEGLVMAQPVDPVRMKHLEDSMLANLIRFIISTNFSDGELTRPAGNKKAA